MTSPDLQRLAHIRDYCMDVERTIKRYGDSFDTFLSDKDYQKSISFSILQIGEVSNGLSEEYRNETSDVIPWISIRGMRNFVVHRYGSMNKEIIWKTAKEDVPALLDFTNTVLEKPKEKESVIAKSNQAKELIKQQDLKNIDKEKSKNNEIERN